MSSYFSKRATDYLQKSNKGLWRIVREKEREAIAQWVVQGSGASLLDAGAGAGYYSLYFKQNFNLEVTAVDSTAEMVEQLKKNGIRSQLAMLETLELEEKFETVVAAGVFEFISDPERALFKLCAHLKENGRLILLIPADGVIGSLYRFFHTDIETFIRPPEFYVNLGQMNGLKVISTQKPTPMSRVIVFEKIRQEVRE